MLRLASRLLLAATTVTIAGSAFGADMDQVVFDQVPVEQASLKRSEIGEESITGHIEGNYAYSSADVEGFDLDANSWAIRGSVNGETHNSWNLQLDAGYGQTHSLGTSIDSLVGAAHAYYRQPDRFALGAFVQGARIGGELFDNAGLLGLDDYAGDVVAGGEGAVYMDQVTVFGRLGYGQAFYTGENADHILAGAGVRIYATDDLRFDLEGGLNRLSVQGGDATIYTVAGIGNYRLPNVPVTAFGGYRYDHGKLEVLGFNIGNADIHSLVAGLRFSFGTQTLKQEERSGPAWSSAARLF